MQPVRTESIKALLATLPDLSEQQDALLDSFVLKPDGDVWLYTAPSAGRASVPVRLGTDGFAEKLDRLDAYWQRAVLTRPETAFSLIDLRFDSQVVTREG